MPTMEAVRVARERNLDLVEVAPTADPPVCRLLNDGRFRFEQAKNEREARKHLKTAEIREVRFHPKIDPHDLNMKVKQAQRLLQEGDKVKVSVLFRGREMSHPELGRHLLSKFMTDLVSVATIEKPPDMEGRNMNLILAPLAPKVAKTEEGKNYRAENEDA